MASDETRYTNKIFMAAALPLMKTIATDVPTNILIGCINPLRNCDFHAEL